MRFEDYQTVLQSTEDRKEWLLNNQLLNLDPAERVSVVEQAFLVMANRHDDETAARFFIFLMQAIDDVEFVPLLKKKGARFEVPYTNDREQTVLRARTNRAAKAVAIYPKIQATRKVTGHWREDDMPMSGPIDELVLLKTRKAILEEAAGWWRGTKDESEADQLFQFLVTVFEQRTNFSEEEKMRIDVVYQATNKDFPSDRLARHFLQLAVGEHERQVKLSEIARILAVAWGRNTDLVRIALRLRATQPIATCSAKLFDLIEKLASEEATPLEKAALELKKALEAAHFFVNLAYLALNQVDIRLPLRAGFALRYDENEWHERFETAKKLVVEWRQKYPYTVKLTLTATKEWESEPVFKRSQSF